MFTPLDKKNTDTQSINVQLRKDLDLHVNLVRRLVVGWCVLGGGGW